MKKAIFTLLILLISFQFSLAQEKPKAELVDEVTRMYCCDFGSRLIQILHSDRFKTDKSLELFLIIHGKSDIIDAITFEKIARGAVNDPVYNFDKSRVKFFRSNRGSEVKIVLWLVPKGADTSIFTDDNLDLSQLEIKKPKLYLSSAYEAVLCFGRGDKDFSEILSANPELRGHIVIFENSAKKFSKTEKELLNEFTEKLNVPRNQLRTFFIKQPKNNMPYYELWLVPKRSK